MSWEMVKLSELVNINIGRTPSRSVSSFWGEGKPWLSIADMSQGRNLIYTKEQITEKAILETKPNIALKGTVLFSFKLSIGKIGIAKRDMYHNEAIASFPIKDNERLHREYLIHALSRINYSGATDRAVMGATLNKKKLAELQIPLPPLPIQKQIAAILEKADTLRQQCQQMQTELNALAQSVFLEMFGDPVTNPKGWEIKPLRELVSIQSGATPSKSNETFWSGEYPWVSPKDMKTTYINDSIEHISEVTFKETNLKRIKKGALLIVVRGMILAHTVPLSILKREVAINQDIKALSVIKEKVEPVFLLWCLKAQHDYLLNKISTAAHGTKKLDMSNLQNLRICVPSSSLQRKFCNIVTSLDSQIETHALKTAHSKNLFNALMQKAFNGELIPDAQ